MAAEMRYGEAVAVLDATSSTWGNPKTRVATLFVDCELPNPKGFSSDIAQEPFPDPSFDIVCHGIAGE
ncbi:hypothetical protein [Dendronalium sp. ChiSLP03b]|uniref:hypothetical protein n=1 Tax=Dendronalium sp. ChiSLP03b TaxID=3075381 RepID=UPI002AD320D4|nr:hypothetical protein [Dendronalium sp. ChiSLP03b]MDZ8207247.1 hypothetical protein [Dendronalium sp. ChiSLP03b]